MYKIILVIDRYKGENTFPTRNEAQEVVSGLQRLFAEHGFHFVAYDRIQNYYLYKHDDGTRGRFGLFVVPIQPKDGEPFLRTRKTSTNKT
jgi:hypothetical protein